MIRIFDRYFIDEQFTVTKRELAACMLIILMTAYAIAPNLWEPAAESFNNWVSARIFRQTGRFPVLYHGSLYILYLQIFLFFDYPLSIQLEHFVTHMFTYTSLFLLLRRFLPTAPAMLLTCAWIPTLWTIEGGSRIAGMGFLALYLKTDNSLLNKGCIPVCLAAASLCDQAYTPFFAGHLIGTLIQKLVDKEQIVDTSKFLKRKNILPITVKAAMILLFVLTISFQSTRPDNNPQARIDPWPPYPEFSKSSILAQAIISAGNWGYVTRNIPISEWLYQDWYFTHKEVFGGATSILDTVINQPEIFIKNVFTQILNAVEAPLHFLFGFRFHRGFLWLNFLFLSWFVMPVCFYRIFKFLNMNNCVPHIYSIIFGTGGIVASLIVTRFYARYAIVLLPVALMVAAHVGVYLKDISQAVQKKNLFKSTTDTPKNTFKKRGDTILIVLGSTLITAGIVLNDWILTDLLGQYKVEGLTSRLPIWIIEIVLIATGTLLILKRGFFLSIIRWIENSPYSNKQSLSTTTILLLMIICLLYTSIHNQFINQKKSIKLIANPFTLDGKMYDAHEELFSSLNFSTRVLALEAAWIKTFAKIKIDNVFHPLYLPPFRDPSGDSERFLSNLDVIWVSNDFSNMSYSWSTQIYIRYLYHVKPFLKNALKNGWTLQQIEGFGRIYQKTLKR